MEGQTSSQCRFHKGLASIFQLQSTHHLPMHSPQKLHTSSPQHTTTHLHQSWLSSITNPTHHQTSSQDALHPFTHNQADHQSPEIRTLVRGTGTMKIAPSLAPQPATFNVWPTGTDTTVTSVACVSLFVLFPVCLKKPTTVRSHTTAALSGSV